MASVLVPVVHDMTGVLDVCSEFLIAVRMTQMSRSKH